MLNASVKGQRDIEKGSARHCWNRLIVQQKVENLISLTRNRS